MTEAGAEEGRPAACALIFTAAGTLVGRQNPLEGGVGVGVARHILGSGDHGVLGLQERGEPVVPTLELGGELLVRPPARDLLGLPDLHAEGVLLGWQQGSHERPAVPVAVGLEVVVRQAWIPARGGLEILVPLNKGIPFGPGGWRRECVPERPAQRSIRREAGRPICVQPHAGEPVGNGRRRPGGAGPALPPRGVLQGAHQRNKPRGVAPSDWPQELRVVPLGESGHILEVEAAHDAVVGRHVAQAHHRPVRLQLAQYFHPEVEHFLRHDRDVDLGLEAPAGQF